MAGELKIQATGRVPERPSVALDGSQNPSVVHQASQAKDVGDLICFNFQRVETGDPDLPAGGDDGSQSTIRVIAHDLEMLWICTLTKAGWARVTATVVAPRTGIPLRIELGSLGSLSKDGVAAQCVRDMAMLCLELQSEKAALPGRKPRVLARAESGGAPTTIRRADDRTGRSWRIQGRDGRKQSFTDDDNEGSGNALLAAYREMRSVLIPDRHGIEHTTEYWKYLDPLKVQPCEVLHSGHKFMVCKYLALRDGPKTAWSVRFDNDSKTITIPAGSDGVLEYTAACEFLRSVYLPAQEGEWLSTSHPDIPIMHLPHPLRIGRRSRGKGKPAQLGIAFIAQLGADQIVVWLPLSERSQLTADEISYTASRAEALVRTMTA